MNMQPEGLGAPTWVGGMGRCEEVGSSPAAPQGDPAKEPPACVPDGVALAEPHSPWEQVPPVAPLRHGRPVRGMPPPVEVAVHPALLVAPLLHHEAAVGAGGVQKGAVAAKRVLDEDGVGVGKEHCSV